MAGLLHKKNITEPSNQAVTPHEVLQQINMEDEFAPELDLLKKQVLTPRPQAVEQLLQLIHGHTVEQH